jgi:hypothetical protein
MNMELNLRVPYRAGNFWLLQPRSDSQFSAVLSSIFNIITVKNSYKRNSRSRHSKNKI